jgi:hypothetical protein
MEDSLSGEARDYKDLPINKSHSLRVVDVPPTLLGVIFYDLYRVLIRLCDSIPYFMLLDA